jgi:hypothetical protein
MYLWAAIANNVPFSGHYGSTELANLKHHENSLPHFSLYSPKK